LTAVDACFFYRIKLPLEELARTGRWEVSWGAPGPDIHEYDVVIGQRLAGDNSEWLRLCADPNVLTVYDMDDDLLHLDPENTIPYQIYAPLVEGTRRNVEHADVVTVCTPYVYERMSELNDNVHYLPICTTHEMIDLPLRTSADRLTVGWGGSPFHHQDWERIPEVLSVYYRLVPRATFHTLGGNYTGGVFGSRLRHTGLQTIENYYATLDLDIGIAPLLHSPSNRGKSHTKPLEYATRGTPVIASNWGQYVDWVQHGVNGFLVETMDDWLPYLLALSDDELRGRMSTAARESARQYTIDRHAHLWERAYGVMQ
jgi:glycosyltransferase involved in cell wall biosynthesis